MLSAENSSRMCSYLRLYISNYLMIRINAAAASQGVPIIVLMPE